MLRKLRLAKILKQGNNKNWEDNKEESGKIIKDLKQYEESDRKDNNSRVSRNKSYENETNIHKKSKRVIHTTCLIRKTRKESSNEEVGSTDERETNKMKEKETNRQVERKYDNYSKNDVKMNKRS